MDFVNEDNLKNSSYDNYPFPHTIIDNFLKNDVLDNILLNINNLKDEDADCKFINPSSPYEYNKYAFSSNYGDYLNKIIYRIKQS